MQGFRLMTGKLLTVSRSKGTQIRTSTATIGIRGTGYYIEADPEQTYFCTCYGLTDVESNDDPSSRDTVASKHHDKPLYILANQQPGQNIRRAGFIDHTDQELMLIETLVGRTTPGIRRRPIQRAAPRLLIANCARIRPACRVECRSTRKPPFA